MKKGELLDNVYKSNLPSRAKQVMFYLINRANGEGTCFPSINTIASDCGVSKRTIQRTMNVLLEAGFIKKDSRFREQGSQTSNLYTIEMSLELDNGTDKASVKDGKKEIEVIRESEETAGNIEVIDFDRYIENAQSLANESEGIQEELIEINEHQYQDQEIIKDVITRSNYKTNLATTITNEEVAINIYENSNQNKIIKVYSGKNTKNISEINIVKIMETIPYRLPP